MGQKKLRLSESTILWTAGIAALGLRLILLFRYRFDSDEPQHMHVSWAWAHGLVQYRDVFDNHMPLFHILWAPLFRIAGDDVNVLYLARLSVLPFFVAAVYLVYVIGTRMFDRRTARWAAALAAVMPPFFLGTLEYRTDDVWVVLWLAMIAVLLGDRDPSNRTLLAGALLGLAFGVSMKSVLFAISLAVAIAGTVMLTRHRGGLPRPREIAGRALSLIAVAASVPLGIAVLFFLGGAWKPFFYCVFQHNATAPFDQWWRVLWLVPGVPLIALGARRYASGSGDIVVVRRRLFTFLLGATFCLTLSALWPVLSLESYLPLYPLAILLIMPHLMNVRLRADALPLLPAAALMVCLVAVTVSARIWRDEAHEEVALIRQILQITQPRDNVMDLKGESLFRRRPYWLVLESITHRKMRRHQLRDDIAAALVRSGTTVLASDEFPAKTRAFVRRNYVRWGRLWVVGHRVLPAPEGLAVPARVSVPGRYILVDVRGRVAGAIDGVPIGDGVELTLGMHRLTMNRSVSQPLIIWAGVTRAPQFLSRLRDTEEQMRRRHGVRRLAEWDDGPIDTVD